MKDINQTQSATKTQVLNKPALTLYMCKIRTAWKGSERPCREEIDCWKENPVIDQE